MIHGLSKTIAKQRHHFRCWGSVVIVFLAAVSDSHGAELRQLTEDGVLKRDPVFISQGKEIVYSVEHAAPMLVLKRLTLADGSSVRLHPEASLPELRPSFSRDEKRYTFLAMSGNDVIVLKLKKANEVTSLKASGSVVWHPVLTPDGKFVVYNVYGQLILQTLSNGKETVLTKSAGRNDWPSVSPDGKTIAFCSSRNGDMDLYVMNSDGSDVRQLNESRGLDMRPAWSPDGKQIAFTSNRDGNYEIYVMNSDGTSLRRITNHEERDDYPAWHPNGKELVIVSERNGNHDLYLVNVSSR